MSLNGDLAFHLTFQSFSHRLIELNENLNGELRTERTAIHHLIQSLRQAHPDRRSTVQFKRRHSPSPHTIDGFGFGFGVELVILLLLLLLRLVCTFGLRRNFRRTEAEIARNKWEEKSWDLDTKIGHQFKELEALAMECNQAMRRLKLGNDFQYVLNAKGSTPAEIMGIDYKSKLKPSLNSYADDIQKTSMEKLEELISLQQQSKENAAKIEGKRNNITALQSRIEELEAQLSLLKKETQEYTYSCAAEAKKMVEEVQMEAHNLDIVEREAAEVLKTSEWRLQEAVRQSEEEIQMCARDLFSLVDFVSKYKEYVESRISEMKSNLSETVVAVSDAYKNSLPAHLQLMKTSL